MFLVVDTLSTNLWVSLTIVHIHGDVSHYSKIGYILMLIIMNGIRAYRVDRT